MYEDSNFSTSCFLFHYSNHSSGYGVVSLSFYVLIIGHLCFFFGETSIQIFSQFLKIIFLLIFEL